MLSADLASSRGIWVGKPQSGRPVQKLCKGAVIDDLRLREDNGADRSIGDAQPERER